MPTLGERLAKFP
jgi:hypothetical protein